MGFRMETVADRVSALDQVPEWEGIEFLVDSGAAATVIGEESVRAVAATEPDHSRNYRLADGCLIPNMGGKRFKGVTADGAESVSNASVTKVDKPLLSVGQIVRNGGNVVFSDASRGGSYIETANGKKRIALEHRAGVHALQMWIPRSQPSFPRQG